MVIQWSSSLAQGPWFQTSRSTTRLKSYFQCRWLRMEHQSTRIANRLQITCTRWVRSTITIQVQHSPMTKRSWSSTKQSMEERKSSSRHSKMLMWEHTKPVGQSSVTWAFKLRKSALSSMRSTDWLSMERMVPWKQAHSTGSQNVGHSNKSTIPRLTEANSGSGQLLIVPSLVLATR